MTTKKILLAGIAAGALAAAAGSASALNLSGSTIGGVTVSTTPATAGVVTPYFLANEAKGPFTSTAATVNATTGVVTGANASLLNAALTTGALTSGQYLVTYTISGGSFVPSSISGTNLACANTAPGTPSTASNCSASVQSSSVSSVTFLVTVNGSVLSFEFGVPFTMTGPGAVTFTAAVALASSSTTTIDNGTATGQLISTRAGFATTIGATPATSTTATIASAFKLFASGTTATIGSYTIVPTVATTGNTATYRDLIGTATTQADVTGATFSLTSGSLGSTETITVSTSTTNGGGSAVTSAPGSTIIPAQTYNGNNAVAPNSTIVLTQTGTTTATQAILAASPYVLSVAPVLVAQYSAGTAASITLGSVTYQGTSILAPWVPDGTNGFQPVIRLSSMSGAALPAYTVTILNPLATTANSNVCNFAAPGSASVLITSSNLTNCFGNYGNSDFLISVQGTAPNLTAKLRIVNGSTGVVTEQSLGSGNGVTFGTTNTGGATVAQ